MSEPNSTAKHGVNSICDGWGHEAFPFHAAGEHKTGQCNASDTDKDAGSGSGLVGQWITDLPQDLTSDDDFSTAIVRYRNVPNEMTRDAIIKTSMTCRVMCGLRKKMAAMAPHSQTLNCAKAASCICHIAKLKYSSKIQGANEISKCMFEILSERNCKPVNETMAWSSSHRCRLPWHLRTWVQRLHLTLYSTSHHQHPIRHLWVAELLRQAIHWTVGR